MKCINYIINEKATLSISKEVLDKLHKYKQIGNRHEAGGILLGRIKDDYSKYEIIDISEPCSKDNSNRLYFVRNKKKAQKIINKAFEESGGIIQYMGEWHTHPEKYPRPSYTDKRLVDVCSKQENVPKIIFMLILGYEGDLYVGCSENSVGLKKINENRSDD